MIDLSEPYDFDNDADAATDSERRIAEERDRQPNWSFDSDDDTPPALSHPRTRDDLPAERSPRPKRDVPALQKARELPEGVPADEILCGDNLELIRRLPDKCVSLVITSPPYFRQRDYGGAGIGNENELAEYLDALLTLFAECVRVTADEGGIVFNLGDKYEDSSLLLVPYRFAIAASAAFPVRLVNAVT